MNTEDFDWLSHRMKFYRFRVRLQAAARVRVGVARQDYLLSILGVFDS